MLQNNNVEFQEVGTRTAAHAGLFSGGKIKWLSLAACLLILLVAVLTLTVGAFSGTYGAHAASVLQGAQSTHTASFSPHKVSSPKRAHSLSHIGRSKPVLSASVLSLNFSAVKGSKQTIATQIVTVSNGGTRSLYWHATVSPATATWLTLSPLKSQQPLQSLQLGIGTASDKPSQLIVGINPSGLNAGTYTAQITLTGTDQESQSAGGSPQTITVTLKVS